MRQNSIENIVIFVCLTLIFSFFLLVIYGTVKLYDHTSSKTKQVQEQQEQSVKIQEQVYRLNSAGQALPTIDHIITIQRIAEAQRVAEQKKAEKSKINKEKKVMKSAKE